MSTKEKAPLTPLVRWAGGKRKLLDQIRARIPKYYRRYYEPFVGGGAVLFGVALPEHGATINDKNEQLINLYQQVKSRPVEMIEAFQVLDKEETSKSRYYVMRDRFNEKLLSGKLDVESASLFLWINRRCVNALYRVNQSGLFNTPYNNSKSTKTASPEQIQQVSEYFTKKRAEIQCGDFMSACASAKPGDFVYLDPPYSERYTGYTKDKFGSFDQKRVAQLFHELDARGVYVMESNSNTVEVQGLYKGYRIDRVNITYAMMHVQANEVIITNY